MKRITGPIVELWVSNAEVASLLSTLARRLGIPYRVPSSTRGEASRSVRIISCGHEDEDFSGRGVRLDCKEYNLSPIAFAISAAKMLVGGLREIIIGVDPGFSRIAVAVLASSTLLYHKVYNSIDRVVIDLCVAAQKHREVRIGVGFTPAVSSIAQLIAQGVRSCGGIVSFVDERGSNNFHVYGIKGAESIRDKDVIAAMQIALRVYDVINKFVSRE